MKIFLKDNQTTFKQIKLNNQEKKATQILFNSFKDAHLSTENSILHAKIFEVFSKHLDSESKLKSNGFAWQAGQFAKEIYIKFFTALKDVKLGTLDSDTFVEILNKYNPPLQKVNNLTTSLSNKLF